MLVDKHIYCMKIIVINNNNLQRWTNTFDILYSTEIIADVYWKMILRLESCKFSDGYTKPFTCNKYNIEWWSKIGWLKQKIFRVKKNSYSGFANTVQ